MIVKTDEKNYQDIADAIRSKLGTDATYLPSEMAGAIEGMPSPPQFGLIGWDAEDTNMYNAQVAEAIAYSKALYDAWDANNTTAQSLYRNDKILVYAPKINMSNVTDAGYMFQGCTALKSVPQLDTSNATKMLYMFQGCTALTSIPQLDTSKVTHMGYFVSGCTALTSIPQLDTSNVTELGYFFINCTSLTTIPQLDVSSAKSFQSTFANCSALENLGGFVNCKVTLNLSYSTKLTHDSLMNVINNLYDLASNGLSAKTLTLGATNLAKLTDEEQAIAVNKGWTLA